MAGPVETRYSTATAGAALRLLDRRAVLDLGLVGRADQAEGNSFVFVPWLSFGLGL